MEGLTTALLSFVSQKVNSDLFHYHYWIQSFETFVEESNQSVATRMHYLSSLTTGEAHKAIEGYLALRTESAYREARQTLHKRYGDKYLLARELKKRIREWPVISHTDGKGLRRFFDFLRHCKTTMEPTRHLSSLHTEEGISLMISELPYSVADKWSVIVDRFPNGFGEESQGYPPFERFCEFLEEKARQASNAHDQRKTGPAQRENRNTTDN